MFCSNPDSGSFHLQLLIAFTSVVHGRETFSGLRYLHPPCAANLKLTLKAPAHLDDSREQERKLRPIMRLLATATFIAFAAFAASRAIRASHRSVKVSTSVPYSTLRLREPQSSNVTSNISTIVVAADPLDEKWGLDTDDEDGEDDNDEREDEKELTSEEKEQIWCKAKSRGVQLTKAMMMNDQEAATLLQWPYAQSPWDGDLKYELTKWGYKETGSEDKQTDAACDFDKTHEMGDAFKGINVDPRPAGQGGPNHCFYIEHMNGPTVFRDEDGELPFEEDQYYPVEGKKLRVCGHCRLEPFVYRRTDMARRSLKAMPRLESTPSTVLYTSFIARAPKTPRMNFGNVNLQQMSYRP